MIAATHIDLPTAVMRETPSISAASSSQPAQAFSDLLHAASAAFSKSASPEDASNSAAQTASKTADKTADKSAGKAAGKNDVAGNTGHRQKSTPQDADARNATSAPKLSPPTAQPAIPLQPLSLSGFIAARVTALPVQDLLTAFKAPTVPENSTNVVSALSMQRVATATTATSGIQSSAIGTTGTLSNQAVPASTLPASRQGPLQDPLQGPLQDPLQDPLQNFAGPLSAGVQQPEAPAALVSSDVNAFPHYTPNAVVDNSRPISNANSHEAASRIAPSDPTVLVSQTLAVSSDAIALPHFASSVAVDNSRPVSNESSDQAASRTVPAAPTVPVSQTSPSSKASLDANALPAGTATIPADQLAMLIQIQVCLPPIATAGLNAMPVSATAGTDTSAVSGIAGVKIATVLSPRYSMMSGTENNIVPSAHDKSGTSAVAGQKSAAAGQKSAVAEQKNAQSDSQAANSSGAGQGQGDSSSNGQSSAGQGTAPTDFAGHAGIAIAHAQASTDVSPAQLAPLPAVHTTPDNTAQGVSNAPGLSATPEVLPVINTAKLVQSIGQSEMRLGMHSGEFGNISIRTSATRDLISAQISIDHGDLGKALAAHLPEMQARLSNSQGMNVRIDMSGQGSGQSSGQGSGQGTSHGSGQGSGHGAGQGSGTTSDMGGDSANDSRGDRRETSTASANQWGSDTAIRQQAAATVAGAGRPDARLDVRI